MINRNEIRTIQVNDSSHYAEKWYAYYNGVCVAGPERSENLAVNCAIARLEAGLFQSN